MPFPSSDAVTGAPTLVPAGEFSGTDRVVFASPKDGSRLVSPVSVDSLPGLDQGLVPSSLLARTRTWYPVSRSRPLMVVDVPVPVKPWLVHVESPLFLYCTS